MSAKYGYAARLVNPYASDGIAETVTLSEKDVNWILEIGLAYNSLSILQRDSLERLSQGHTIARTAKMLGVTRQIVASEIVHAYKAAMSKRWPPPTTHAPVLKSTLRRRRIVKAMFARISKLRIETAGSPI